MASENGPKLSLLIVPLKRAHLLLTGPHKLLSPGRHQGEHTLGWLLGSRQRPSEGRSEVHRGRLQGLPLALCARPAGQSFLTDPFPGTFESELWEEHPLVVAADVGGSRGGSLTPHSEKKPLWTESI